MNFNIQKINQFIGHKDSIFDLSDSNDLDCFYSASADGYVVEWNLNDAAIGTPIIKMPSSVYSIFRDKTEPHLYIAANNIGLFKINILTKKILAELPIKSTFYDIISKGEMLYLADKLGNVYKIEKTEMKVISAINFSNHAARCIALKDSSNEMAVGFSDNIIRIIDLETLQIKHQLVGHSNSVFSLIYTQNEAQLISAGRDAKLLFWNENYELIDNIPAHLFAINKLISIAKFGLIISCSMDKTIKIWQMSTRKLLKVIDNSRFESHSSSINSLLWNDKSEVLLAASDDKKISMWKIF